MFNCQMPIMYYITFQNGKHVMWCACFVVLPGQDWFLGNFFMCFEMSSQIEPSQFAETTCNEFTVNIRNRKLNTWTVHNIREAVYASTGRVTISLVSTSILPMKIILGYVTQLNCRCCFPPRSDSGLSHVTRFQSIVKPKY